METREEILKELRAIAPNLASLEKRNYFTVPENYFAHFRLIILDLVETDIVKEELKAIAPELAKAKTNFAPAVPDDYFKKFSFDVMNKIRAEELTEIAPTLAQLQKLNRLEVPANYFNAFPEVMMKRIAAEENAMEVSVTPVWLQKINSLVENAAAIFLQPKYSVAFAGIASMLVVGMMLFPTVEKQCSDIDCKMAQLSNEEIDSYLQSNTDSYSDEIFELNDEANLPSTENTDNDAFKNALNSLTDDELNNAILD